MRKIAFILLFVAVVFAACSSSETPEVKAALAARQYYEHLQKGEYRQFVDGHVGSEHWPEAYRSQLIDNAKMFVAKINKERGGLDSVFVANCKVDESGQKANAFLLLCFKDKDREEIVVPIIAIEDTWRMQ